MGRIRKAREETDADRLARYTRIVKAFEAAGLDTTQRGIGAALVPSVSQAAVSAWKRVNPSIGHLAQIATLTGVSGHWLLTGDGPMMFDTDADQVDVMRQMIDALSDKSRATLLERLTENRRKRSSRRG